MQHALSIDAAELARFVRAVEKSAARDDSRSVLNGIHARVQGDTLTVAVTDGF